MSFTVKGQDFEKDTVSFDDAIDSISDARRARQDFELPLNRFYLGVDSSGENIVGNIEGREYRPTMHCLKQIASVMDVPHSILARFLTDPTKTKTKFGVPREEVKYRRDRKDKELLVSLFHNGVRDGRVDPDKRFRFRTYTDGTLRAMVTDRYAPIDNVWYLEHLKKVFKNIGGDEPRLIHWRGDADTLYGNVLIPDSFRDESDSSYGGMISISNCEIKKRSLGLLPSIFRSLCTNGLIFGQEFGERLRQIHMGDIDLNDLRDRISATIEEQIPLFSDGIDRFLAMNDRKLEVPPSFMIAQIAQDHNLSYGKNGQAMAIATQFAEHETDNRNLFGITNAITRTAQIVTPADQVKLETLGGRLMGLKVSDWSQYNQRAKAMPEKIRNKVFGVVADS
jgi:hypothetical protein